LLEASVNQRPCDRLPPLLQNIQSLNIKCGLPPIPNAAASDGTAGGGLGAVPDSVPTAADSTGGTAAAGATTPATVQISTAPEQSLSARGGGESPTAAALATPAVGATTTAGTAGGTTAGTDAAAAAAAAGAADVGASTGVNAAGIPQSVSNTGGAGTTGTAFDTGGAISCEQGFVARWLAPCPAAVFLGMLDCIMSPCKPQPTQLQ
jgi:hypothetical protein